MRVLLVQPRSDAIVRHPEIIGQWRAVGLGGVFIGFEKSDQAGLEAVDKHNSVENNERALEVLRKQGVEPTTSFIVDPDYGHTVLFEEVRGRLTTANRELFDLAHAVLPTLLPPVEFYEELARLWREAYPRWKLGLAGLHLSLRDLWSRRPGAAHWQRVLAEGRRFGDARVYLEGWAQAQGDA